MLLSRYLSRLKSKEEIILPSAEFQRLYSNIVKWGGRVLGSKSGRLGSYKITTESERIINENAISDKRDCLHLVVSEVAKISLLSELERSGKRFKYTKKQIELLDSLATIPQYAIPTHLEDAVYIDLKSAYFTIYSRFLYVDYLPNRFLMLPSVLPDFRDIADRKHVRNSLFGLMRSRKGIVFNRSGAKVISVKNPLFNPSLCLLTYDILNAIALEMIEIAGALYVNTDGYIIPSSNLPEAQEIAKRWGFELKIEGQGEADIVGIGCYKVGEKVSEPYKQRRIKKPMALCRINCLSEPSWLFRRVSSALL